MEDLSMSMSMMIDLEDVDRLVNSEDFTHFLLSHTTDFSTAAFILDTLFKKIAELK